MPNAKYQIFISSTYQDLKDERDQVIKACLEMGHIPVGMEMFSAADEEQWKIITRQIDESDYYIVIVAQRYGSIVEGMSYTEKEYDYALEQGIPTLGFIIDASARWPTDRIESSEESRAKLNAFKQKVRQKPVDFWSSKDELHAKCAIALMKSFNTRPRPGWVRASELSGPEVASEISRLSSENARLRAELDELKRTPDTSHLSQGDDQVCLRIQRTSGSKSKPVKVSATWNALFLVIAKAIITRPEEGKIEESIVRFLSSELKIQTYEASLYALTKEDLESIKTQFLALELIRIDYATHSYEYDDPRFGGKTTNTVVFPIWKLTSHGERLYTSLAAIRR